MKSFIQKSILFALLIPIFILGSYYAIDLYYNYQKDEDAIFIWGDSQAYQGIDLPVLARKTTKKVYSASKHGASVYDFLIFSERVPDHSYVIVSISKLVQVRRKEKDYNRSGISIRALWTLYENHYSIAEILSIMRNNKRPVRNFVQQTDLYPYEDTIAIGLPVSHFQSYYQQVPFFLRDKQTIYLAGIQRLIDKHCHIIFIEFPYHPILMHIEDHSPVKAYTENFKADVLSLFNVHKTDTLQLERQLNVMHDLSHLNEFGAKEVSEQLSQKIKLNREAEMYIVHWRNAEDLHRKPK